jgi:predicted glycosyltransferase
MRVLFDIGHPAHLHYFRNAASTLQNDGHSVLFSLRDKDIAEQLLQIYNFEYVKIGKSKKGIVNKILGVINFTWKTIKLVRKFKPDLIVSFYSPYAAYASFFTRVPSIGFADTEHAIYNIKTTYPFTNTSITPSCFTLNLGKKHLMFKGYMELSYLHPVYFTPDPGILAKLNIFNEQNYVVLRFVSWDAHHDIGKHGVTNDFKVKLVNLLKQKYRVFISSEKELPSELEIYRLNINPSEIHHVLFYASFFVSESGTMASESAILGTPVVYTNELPLMGYLIEAKKNGLLFHITDEVEIFQFLNTNFMDSFNKEDFKLAKETHTKDTINLTAFMVWFIENYPQSLKTMKENPDYQLRFK